MHRWLLWVWMLLLPLEAAAWQHRTCNGWPIRWDDGRANIDIDRCSIPPGSRRAESVWYALSEWNSVGAMPPPFAVGGKGSCGVRHGDDRSAVAFVHPDHIDGNLGVTRRYYTRGCWRWAMGVALAETDVMLSAALDSRIGGRQPLANLEPDPVCDQTTRPRYTERATILHELGHALGLDHEDHEMALMMTREGEGRYCGDRPFMPHPDDVAGARRLYGDGSPTADLAASPWRWAGPDSIGPVHPIVGAERMRVPRGCAGSLVDVQYSVANFGSAPAGYRLWWFASFDDVWSWDDHLLSVGEELQIGATRFETRRATLRISRHLEAGRAYRLGYVVAPTHPWADERRQGDNTAFIRPTMIRDPEEQCP